MISDVARSLPGWIQYLYRTVGLAFLLTPLEGSDGTVHATVADDLQNGKGKERGEVSIISSPLILPTPHPPGGYYSYCIPAHPHPAAEDPVLCRKVWQAACDELGLDDDWLRDAKQMRQRLH